MTAPRLLPLLLLVALLAASTGCIGSSSPACVPVKVENKYPISGGMTQENSLFSEHFGIAIIGGQAYPVGKKKVYDALAVNETNNIAISSAGAPSYNYVYWSCDIK